MLDAFYTDQELFTLGLKKVGKSVKLSRKASLYSPSTICIGNNVRIDDFCILSGEINIGSYVHIAAYSALYGSHGITIKDYSGLSARTIVYSAVDDFSGTYMISPLVPKELTMVSGGIVKIERFVQVGAGSIILPGITLGEGSVVGALSLVKHNLCEWTIYAGIPAKQIKQRNRNILELVKRIST